MGSADYIHCHECGRKVPRADAVRVQEVTGGWTSSSGGGTHWSYVSVCPKCADARNKALLVLVVIGLAFAALMGVGAVVLFLVLWLRG